MKYRSNAPMMVKRAEAESLGASQRHQKVLSPDVQLSRNQGLCPPRFQDPDGVIKFAGEAPCLLGLAGIDD